MLCWVLRRGKQAGWCSQRWHGNAGFERSDEGGSSTSDHDHSRDEAALATDRAAVELKRLTYKRANDDDPFVSDDFDMESFFSILVAEWDVPVEWLNIDS